MDINFVDLLVDVESTNTCKYRTVLMHDSENRDAYSHTSDSDSEQRSAGGRAQR